MKSLRTTPVILATILAIAANAADESKVAGTPWRILERTDAITDERSYLVSTLPVGDARAGANRFVIEVVPKGTTPSGGLAYKAKVSLYSGDSCFTVNAAKIFTRFDRDKATAAQWMTAPPNFEIAFAPDPYAIIDRLKTATNLTVRFQTLIGETKTLKYPVADLPTALKRLKEIHASQ